MAKVYNLLECQFAISLSEKQYTVDPQMYNPTEIISLKAYYEEASMTGA